MLARQRRELCSQPSGSRADATSSPAALPEKAGRMIRPSPTRKQGAEWPETRSTG